jgi:RNA polymerase sigma-70 factor (ECF subfamily)
MYDIFAPRMYSVCIRYARIRDDAKDIFQSGFLKIWENISQIFYNVVQIRSLRS